MAMTVFIQLTSAGDDVGPFNLYENYSGWQLFATGVAKQTLLDGVTYTNINNGTTQIKLESTGVCDNEVIVDLSTTSTTSTTSAEAPSNDRTTYSFTVETPPCGWEYPRSFEVTGMSPSEICSNYFYSIGADPTTIDYVRITALSPPVGATFNQGIVPLVINAELPVNILGQYDDGGIFMLVNSEVVSGVAGYIKFQVVFEGNSTPSIELTLNIYLDACQDAALCEFYQLTCNTFGSFAEFGFTECGGTYTTLKVYFLPVSTYVCVVKDSIVSLISGDGTFVKLGECSAISSTTTTTTTGATGDCYTVTIPYADLQDAGLNLYIEYIPPTLGYPVAVPYYDFVDYGSTDFVTYLCSSVSPTFRYDLTGEQFSQPSWYSQGCTGCCSDDLDCVLT